MSLTNHEDDLTSSLSKLNIEDSDDQLRRSTRPKTLTMKARENAIENLKKQKEKILKRIQRKKSTIEDMMYSKDNAITVKEEIQLLDELFRMLEDISLGELQLEEENDDWFEEHDERMCMFKHKVHNWLKQVQEDAQEAEVMSRNSRKSRSTTSRSSGRSNRSKEDKKKLLELEVSSKFLQKKAEMKILAERMELEEKMEKLCARVKVDEEEMKFEFLPSSNEVQDLQIATASCINPSEKSEKLFEEIRIEAMSTKDLNKKHSKGEISLKKEHNESKLWSINGVETEGLSTTNPIFDDAYLLKGAKPKLHADKVQKERFKSQAVTLPTNSLNIDANVFQPSYQTKSSNNLMNQYFDYHENANVNVVSEKMKNTGDGIGAFRFKEPKDLDPKKTTFKSTEPLLPSRHTSNELGESVYKGKETSNEDSTFKKLCDILSLQSAPSVKIQTFKGDPKEFDYFTAMFQEVVEKRVKDQVGRLTRLLEYTEGEANELIRHCMQQPIHSCYDNAKELLRKQYGNPQRILASYREEIKSISIVRPNDSTALRRLFIFLIKVQSLNVGRSSNPLDNSDTICRILSKLPTYMQDRWSRIVLATRRNDMREPTLKDLISLLEAEMTMLEDPMFSRVAVNAYKERGEKQERDQRKTKMKTFASEISCQDEPRKYQCCLCNKNHQIESCHKYLAMSREERSNFVFKQKLCFKCLQPTEKFHSASNCKKPLICIVCGREHPTTLHGLQRSREKSNYKSKESSNQDKLDEKKHEKDNEGDKKKIVSAFTQSSTKTISLCVVPVQITHKGSSKVISTFAMLDSCSQGTFVTKHLTERLGLYGRSTSLAIKTVNGEKEHQTTAIENLLVRRDDTEDQWLTLRKSFTQEEIPMDEDDVATYDDIKKWEHLKEVLEETSTQHDNVKVDILIGANCPTAIEPLQFIQSKDGGPYAVKTRLGWCIVGPIDRERNKTASISANRTACKELELRSKVTKFEENDTRKLIIDMYNQDFAESQVANTEVLSKEDDRFMKIVEAGTRMVGGKYEVPLPFKDKEYAIPNNKLQAWKRFQSLQRKLSKNEEFKLMYMKAMQEMLDKGYAELAYEEKGNKDWSIPHHGVIHPNKPNKVRIVFDASAEYHHHCINRRLLKGPDLTNQLIGVLIRFREERIAITADIEGMFFQVKLPPQHRSYFKFLWYKDNDSKNEPQDYQMTSHIFGGTSSPSCSNYALRKTSEDHGHEFNKVASDALLRNFYVDDLLKSLATEQEAIMFVEEVKDLCWKGGFKLTKFLSNKPEVLVNLADDLRIETIKRNLLNGNPEHSTLGMKWDPVNDTLCFKLNKEIKPTTRRGMLSTISSIYDPLGLVSPYLLAGKKILQNLCKLNFTWDDKVPENIQREWELWKRSLIIIERISLQRCLRPADVLKPSNISLHIFSDASDTGYGIACYLRYIDERNHVGCSLLYGRSRVNPMKYVSIPRMELAAALLAAKTKQLLIKELDLQVDDILFWTDSQVVLGYLRNEARRFKTFVANRVQQIQELSNISAWHYVASKDNPADHASRGFHGKQLHKINQWFHGPDFLYNSDIQIYENEFEVAVDDPECKSIKHVNAIVQEDSFLRRIFNLSMNWLKIVRIMAYILRFVQRLRIKGSDAKINNSCLLSTIEMDDAKQKIFKTLHKEHYFKEINSLRNNAPVTSSSEIYKLKPILVDDIVRVGGRLSKSCLPYHQKYPIILPKNNPVTDTIIRFYHNQLGHSGRNTTINSIRQNGFWIINCTSQVRRILSKCVTCRKLFAKCEQPQMADLPKERMISAPPFTYVGVDLFGPIYVKVRRTVLKKYGVLFTCLNLRAIHIEIANSLSTDSFILALRRFISRRGNVKFIQSDNGTNFIGAAKEIQDAFDEMDENNIHNFLLNKDVQWIRWKRNPPYASNFGGVWERQIRTIRRVLSALMEDHKEILNEESLHTLMVEVEAAVNSRPLTVENLNDPDSYPLSPSNILTMKSDTVNALPGKFPSASIYSKKQWRRVQYLANQFWYKWQKEYLSTLQERKKWNAERRNLQVGDVVIIREECPRNKWPLGRIIEVNQDENGTVRSVTVKVAITSNGYKHELLRRPANKIVLLVENSIDSLTEEPKDQN